MSQQISSQLNSREISLTYEFIQIIANNNIHMN
jgi:hypothetical protein